MKNEPGKPGPKHSFWERFLNIFLQPQYEWSLIHSENRNYRSIFAKFTFYIILGHSAFTAFSYYDWMKFNLDSPIPNIMFFGLFIYTLYNALVISAYCVLVGFVLNKISPNFGGEVEFNKSMSIALYGLTAAFCASAFANFVQLSFFGQQFSNYLFWVIFLLVVLSTYTMTQGVGILLSVAKKRLIPLFVAIMIVNSIGFVAISYTFKGGEKLLSIVKILPDREKIILEKLEAARRSDQVLKDLQESIEQLNKIYQRREYLY
jgi:hypothetical protein